MGLCSYVILFLSFLYNVERRESRWLHEAQSWKPLWSWPAATSQDMSRPFQFCIFHSFEGWACYALEFAEKNKGPENTFILEKPGHIYCNCSIYTVLLLLSTDCSDNWAENWTRTIKLSYKLTIFDMMFNKSYVNTSVSPHFISLESKYQSILSIF